MTRDRDHYQLVGGQDLQSMVGKEVKVIGKVVGDGKDVDVVARDNAPKSTAGETTAAVNTKQEIELQVERLNVASITPTGSPCRASGSSVR